MAEGHDDDPAGPEPADDEAALGAAVDDALEPELERRRARFLQEIMGVDRIEGVGRSEAEREDRLERERRMRPPDDPPG